ncbi:MAG TPA: lipocalin-like domain-containing protein [Vicinamibacteria bacterium]|nr:lipocalin-like domain-containing protein [Vicinamibacteria bacterium]
MLKRIKPVSVVAVGLSLMLVGSGFAQTNPLQGVWKVTEVTTTGPNASKRAAQPGFYIFTGKHYSIVTVNSDQPRPDLPQDTNTATVAQLQASWGPFTAQSGTYEVKGSEVTFHALAAKNPSAMKAGNFSTSSFKIEGNTLTLVNKANQAGPAANPTTRKATRVE